MKVTLEKKELRGVESPKLYLEIISLEKKLADLNFRASFRKIKNYREIPQTKKKIARIWTILTERAIEKIQND